MKIKELNDLKSIIIEQKNEIIKSVSLNSTMASIDIDGDDVDQIQGNMLCELQNQINLRSANKLKQLDSALKRIEDNCYGDCEDCDEEIPYKRLLFNPCVMTCVSCAEIREFEQR